MNVFREFEVLRHRPLYIAVFLLLIGASLLLLGTKGLHFGIDFTGGTLLERRLDRPASVAEVRGALESEGLADLDLSRAIIQPLDDARDMLIRTQALEAEEIERIDAALTAEFNGVEVRRTELVGPVFGAELIRRALWALAIASLGVLAYVSVRFEFKSGVIAIVAVLHDAIVTLGVMSLLDIELNTAFVAALLTVIGYSLNDTIVIFDRVRENFRFRKRETTAELVNRSVRETMTRSLNTSVTTLFVIVALLLFGGATIRDFSLALFVGVIAGTYSSVFVASPLWAYWKEREEARPRTAARAAT